MHQVASKVDHSSKGRDFLLFPYEEDAPFPLSSLWLCTSLKQFPVLLGLRGQELDTILQMRSHQGRV